MSEGGPWYDTGFDTLPPSAEATISKGFLVIRVTDVGPPDSICEYKVIVDFKTDPGVGWVRVLSTKRILPIVAEVGVRVGLDACVEGEVEGSGVDSFSSSEGALASPSILRPRIKIPYIYPILARAGNPPYISNTCKANPPIPNINTCKE